MTTLTSQDIKTLEQTRQRLSQLTNSLASLQHQIETTHPLPPWSSLHTLSQVISQNLLSVSTHLSTHSGLLSSLAAYPLPTYPGREKEPELNQLLRKKLEPHVEDWVEDGRKAGEELEGEVRGGVMEVTELWEWAGMAANEQARSHEWGGEFTNEEREGGVENVVTGLRRRGLGEESSDESDEDGEDEEGEGREVKEEMKPIAMEDVLRFLVKGEEVKR